MQIFLRLKPPMFAAPASLSSARAFAEIFSSAVMSGIGKVHYGLYNSRLVFAIPYDFMDNRNRSWARLRSSISSNRAVSKFRADTRKVFVVNVEGQKPFVIKGFPILAQHLYLDGKQG